MDILQLWLVVGVPAMALGVVLFLRRSPVLSTLGYLVLIAGFALTTVFDRASGAVFGGVLALLYAAGRGTAMERAPESKRPAGP